MTATRWSHECSYCEHEVTSGKDCIEEHFWRCPFAKPRGEDRDKAIEDYHRGWNLGYNYSAGLAEEEDYPSDASDAFSFGFTMGSNHYFVPLLEEEDE